MSKMPYPALVQPVLPHNRTTSPQGAPKKLSSSPAATKWLACGETAGEDGAVATCHRDLNNAASQARHPALARAIEHPIGVLHDSNMHLAPIVVAAPPDAWRKLAKTM